MSESTNFLPSFYSDQLEQAFLNFFLWLLSNYSSPSCLIFPRQYFFPSSLTVVPIYHYKMEKWPQHESRSGIGTPNESLQRPPSHTCPLLHKKSCKSWRIPESPTNSVLPYYQRYNITWAWETKSPEPLHLVRDELKTILDDLLWWFSIDVEKEKQKTETPHIVRT